MEDVLWRSTADHVCGSRKSGEWQAIGALLRSRHRGVLTRPVVPMANGIQPN